MRRFGTAAWNGTIKEGSGNFTIQSSVLNKTQYSFNSRFAEGFGTNPEELLAAAQAGWSTMKLSSDLTHAGDKLTNLSVITPLKRFFKVVIIRKVMSGQS